MSDNKEFFEPYKGGEPYIFISYAHKDSARVMEIIRKLADDGYRIWYDEGIEGGDKWLGTITKRVKGCRFFFAFLSDSYQSSQYCMREITLADNNHKNVVGIYLEQFEFNDDNGLELIVSNRQNLFCLKDRPEKIFSDIYGIGGLEVCLEEKKEEAPAVRNDVLDRREDLLREIGDYTAKLASIDLDGLTRAISVCSEAVYFFRENGFEGDMQFADNTRSIFYKLLTAKMAEFAPAAASGTAAPERAEKPAEPAAAVEIPAPVPEEEAEAIEIPAPVPEEKAEVIEIPAPVPEEKAEAEVSSSVPEESAGNKSVSHGNENSGLIERLLGEGAEQRGNSICLFPDFFKKHNRFPEENIPMKYSIVIRRGVIKIPDDFFKSCRNLTAVELPDTVAQIGNSAFYGCSLLKKINISGVNSLGKSAFCGCSSLEAVDYPKALSYVPEGIFSYCSSLKKIELTHKVTIIGAKAFHKCTSLEAISVPSLVSFIGKDAFNDCEKLAHVCSTYKNFLTIKAQAGAGLFSNNIRFEKY